MDVAGVHDERYDEVDDIERARRVPSLQLTGSDNRMTLDLNLLTSMGVKLVGRLVGFSDGKAQFSGSLRNMCALSDLKMDRLLTKIDEWATENGLDGEHEPPHRLPRLRLRSRRRQSWTSRPPGYARSSGQLAFILTIRGSRCRCSTARV
jgi:putative flavoprotein involved in K+ transport